MPKLIACAFAVPLHIQDDLPGTARRPSLGNGREVTSHTEVGFGALAGELNRGPAIFLPRIATSRSPRGALPRTGSAAIRMKSSVLPRKAQWGTTIAASDVLDAT